MITDKIYCFYRECGIPGQRELIKLWKEVWTQHGWKPHILTPLDCDRKRLGAMVEKARSLPCVHKGLFEEVNLCRWLAFAQIDGAVADYDVFPIKPFPTQDFGGFVCSDNNGGPGFIVGTRQNFSDIADDILEYQPREDDRFEGKPHVSDMVILQRTKDRYDKILCNIYCYGWDGWKNQPLCHFSVNWFRHPKSELPDRIRALLKEL